MVGKDLPGLRFSEGNARLCDCYREGYANTISNAVANIVRLV